MISISRLDRRVLHLVRGRPRPPAIATLALLFAPVCVGRQPAQTPGLLQPAVQFAATSLPAAVLVGDVNGDGKPDLIGVNTGADTVSVLLGNGSGGFQSKSDFATGSVPHGAAIADLNGDANLDLIVTNTGEDTVSVLLGTGTGSFTPAFYRTGAGPFYAAVDDLNADGIPDLVVVNVSADTVSVLLGLGDGSFARKTDSTVGAGARTVAVGDLNGDGVPDLVVTNVSANSVSVLLGTGAGSFAPRFDIGVGNGPRAVALGDLNADGLLDAVIANVSANTVSVLIGDGTGTFATRTDFPVGTEPRAVALDDIDEDGMLDVIAANFPDATISVLLGTNTGSLSPRVDFATGAGPFALALEDLNGDGRLDLAVAAVSANALSVLINDTAVAIRVTGHSLAFGNVVALQSLDRQFTVTNTGAGTLTGSATTSAPFSIVAGGSYTLSPGASQAVTIRFSPTALKAWSGRVSFTHGGGKVLRRVQGTGALPVPTVTTISPNATQAGGAGFTLAITGGNFVAASVVRWNGSDRPTTFVSSTQVQAAIPPGDIGAAGTSQITVFNPPPGGGPSAPRTLIVSSSAFSLTVTIKGTGSGTVTSDPPGLDCPSVCAATFSVPTVVLAASPAAGATFNNWSAGCHGSSPSCSIGLSPANAATASFSKTFADPTITGGATTIKAQHITELRSAIDTLRSRFGLAGYDWTDATLTPGATVVRRIQVMDLRRALDQAYRAAAVPLPSYSDAAVTAGGTQIRAAHLAELRAAVRVLE